MSEARLVYEKKGDEAHIRFDNPRAHNALTSQMWHDLRDAARDIASDRAIRVATFRGVGGKAFISGTDITKFADYTTGQQGVDYERDIDECMGAIDAIPCTTIAIVEGWAVAAGSTSRPPAISVSPPPTRVSAHRLGGRSATASRRPAWRGSGEQSACKWPSAWSCSAKS